MDTIKQKLNELREQGKNPADYDLKIDSFQVLNNMDFGQRYRPNKSTFETYLDIIPK